MVKSYHPQGASERISGPLLDSPAGRHASRVEVPRVPFDKLSDNRTGEPSAVVRERVEKARAIQPERFKATPLHTNADMGPGEIRQFCPLDQASTNLVKAANEVADAVERPGLSSHAKREAGLPHRRRTLTL